MNKTRNKLWGFFFADSNAILIRSYNCYIQRLYVFNKIRVQVTGWQFIYVGWCFIIIIFFYKNILSFLKRINRYSYVPTKHYFLPTTIPLHLNFLINWWVQAISEATRGQERGYSLPLPLSFSNFNFHCDLCVKRKHRNN